MNTERNAPDLELEKLSQEILACEKKVYDTFIGARPDVEAFEKLLLPNYIFIQPQGIMMNKEENLASLKSGVAFSSAEITKSEVRRISPTSAVIAARVLVGVTVGGRNLSSEIITSTVWVKEQQWMILLHTATTVAPS